MAGQGGTGGLTGHRTCTLRGTCRLGGPCWPRCEREGGRERGERMGRDGLAAAGSTTISLGRGAAPVRPAASANSHLQVAPLTLFGSRAAARAGCCASARRTSNARDSPRRPTPSLPYPPHPPSMPRIRKSACSPPAPGDACQPLCCCAVSECPTTDLAPLPRPQPASPRLPRLLQRPRTAGRPTTARRSSRRSPRRTRRTRRRPRRTLPGAPVGPCLLRRVWLADGGRRTSTGSRRSRSG